MKKINRMTAAVLFGAAVSMMMASCANGAGAEADTALKGRAFTYSGVIAPVTPVTPTDTSTDTDSNTDSGNTSSSTTVTPSAPVVSYAIKSVDYIYFLDNNCAFWGKKTYTAQFTNGIETGVQTGSESAVNSYSGYYKIENNELKVNFMYSCTEPYYPETYDISAKGVNSTGSTLEVNSDNFRVTPSTGKQHEWKEISVIDAMKEGAVVTKVPGATINTYLYALSDEVSMKIAGNYKSYDETEAVTLTYSELERDANVVGDGDSKSGSAANVFGDADSKWIGRSNDLIKYGSYTMGLDGSTVCEDPDFTIDIIYVKDSEKQIKVFTPDLDTLRMHYMNICYNGTTSGADSSKFDSEIASKICPDGPFTTSKEYTIRFIEGADGKLLFCTDKGKTTTYDYDFNTKKATEKEVDTYTFFDMEGECGLTLSQWYDVITGVYEEDKAVYATVPVQY